MIFGIDFETNGLDTEKDFITQVGFVGWDEQKNKPVSIYSKYVYDEAIEISKEIEELTGINKIFLIKYGVPIDSIYSDLIDIVTTEAAKNTDGSDNIFICAHNGTNFDKKFAERFFPALTQFKWIDPCVDVPYPSSITTRKLVHLAAEHNFLNPFAHNAIFDVLTMLNIASNYSWDVIKENASHKTVTIRANVTYSTKDLAKENGFRWNAADKTWLRSIKENKINEILPLPFEIDIL